MSRRLLGVFQHFRVGTGTRGAEAVATCPEADPRWSSRSWRCVQALLGFVGRPVGEILLIGVMRCETPPARVDGGNGSTAHGKIQFKGSPSFHRHRLWLTLESVGSRRTPSRSLLLFCWVHRSRYQPAPSTRDFPQPVISVFFWERVRIYQHHGHK